MKLPFCIFTASENRAQISGRRPRLQEPGRAQPTDLRLPPAGLLRLHGRAGGHLLVHRGQLDLPRQHLLHLRGTPHHRIW